MNKRTLIIIALTIISIAAKAQIAKVDGVTYLLKQVSKTAEVRPGNHVGDLKIPETVSYEGEAYKVTAVADGAFKNCNELHSIVLPKFMTKIGNQAFCWCSDLTTVTIPSTITEIGDSAFFECVSITKFVQTGSTATNKISSSKRSGRSAPSSASTASGGIYLPALTYLGEKAFYGCKNVSAIKNLGSIKEIKELTFYRCSSLTAVNIPNSVTNIGKEAFKYCSSLEYVNIFSKDVELGSGVFNYCGKLKNIAIYKDAQIKCQNYDSSYVYPITERYRDKVVYMEE